MGDGALSIKLVSGEKLSNLWGSNPEIAKKTKFYCFFSGLTSGGKNLTRFFSPDPLAKFGKLELEKSSVLLSQCSSL